MVSVATSFYQRSANHVFSIWVLICETYSTLSAVLEAFFSGFKKEQVYRNKYRTKEELEASVAEYIEFYNEGRPHRKLDMKTPDQFEAEWCCQEFCANWFADLG